MNSKTVSIAAALLVALPLCGWAQVQTPANQVPPGEGRLPTESSAPNPSRPGGDDCRRQAEVVRQQFELQERALRRELSERGKQATGAERERLRAESEQRLAALRAEAVEAERRVMTSCRGG
jgi:hypothetical protein